MGFLFFAFWFALLTLYSLFTFPKLFSCQAFQKFPKVSAHFLYKIPYSKVLKNKKINQAKGVVQQAAFWHYLGGPLE